MSDLRSCGFLIFRREPELSLLLMEHKNRLDLPKGHVDSGETDRQCALRELQEETGITVNDIQIDPDFIYQDQYEVCYKRTGNQPQQKTLLIYLAELVKPVELAITEHQGYHWLPWKPPHQLQEYTIDPLLSQLQTHWEQ